MLTTHYVSFNNLHFYQPLKFIYKTYDSKNTFWKIYE